MGCVNSTTGLEYVPPPRKKNAPLPPATNKPAYEFQGEALGVRPNPKLEGALQRRSASIDLGTRTPRAATPTSARGKRASTPSMAGSRAGTPRAGTPRTSRAGTPRKSGSRAPSPRHNLNTTPRRRGSSVILLLEHGPIERADGSCGFSQRRVAALATRIVDHCGGKLRVELVECESVGALRLLRPNSVDLNAAPTLLWSFGGEGGVGGMGQRDAEDCLDAVDGLCVHLGLHLSSTSAPALSSARGSRSSSPRVVVAPIAVNHGGDNDDDDDAGDDDNHAHVKSSPSQSQQGPVVVTAGTAGSGNQSPSRSATPTSARRSSSPSTLNSARRSSSSSSSSSSNTGGALPPMSGSPKNATLQSPTATAAGKPPKSRINSARSNSDQDRRSTVGA